MARAKKRKRPQPKRRRAQLTKTGRKRRTRPVKRGQFHKLTWAQAKKRGYTKGQWLWARGHSKWAARKRRQDKKKLAAEAAQYGSVKKAKEARKAAQVKERQAEYDRFWKYQNEPYFMYINYYTTPEQAKALWEAEQRARAGARRAPHTPSAASSASASSTASASAKWHNMTAEERSRVRKLINLSSSSNVHEAALAKERANEILKRHGLTMK